jgi:hypothetical protein
MIMKANSQSFPTIFEVITALLRQVPTPKVTTLKDIAHHHVALTPLHTNHCMVADSHFM